MLNENIKALRKSKGLSQQDLADKLNVVRQTISKWEQGLSVPDSDLLIALSEALETPVSTLLGENVVESEADAVKALSEKLEIINLQFARRKAMRRSALHWRRQYSRQSYLPAAGQRQGCDRCRIRPAPVHPG